jgi:hypothetical protein
MRAQIYISRMYQGDNADTVRIDLKDGATLLSRADIPLRDFAAAVMGQGAIECVAQLPKPLDDGDKRGDDRDKAGEPGDDPLR